MARDTNPPHTHPRATEPNRRGRILDRLRARIPGQSPSSPDAAPSPHWTRERRILTVAVGLVAVLSILVMPTWANVMKHVPTGSSYTEIPLALPTLPPQPAPRPQVDWQVVRVESGQTLSGLFQAHGFDYADLKLALDATRKTGALHDLHPGDAIGFLTDDHGTLLGMRYDRDAEHRVTLRFADGTVTRQVTTRDIERREHIAHGVIESSLFDAASRAGLSDAMVVKLADVFKYDIDLAREVRTGDRFTVVYDDVWRDGAYLQAGHIIAAEFYNRGKRFTAFRFTKPDGSIGYYSEDGRPLQRALLRTPLSFTRISSRFGMRMDPILHSRHLHAGIDLAAPMGTPIHAAGNGVITIRGWVRGYGRYVRIRNTPAYSTGYGHMSRFAPGLHVGSHVRQGQVIGYVGESGWATGPHLHYEVRIHGRPVNPLTVTMPKPKPLPTHLLALFRQRMQPLMARITAYDANVRLASRTTDSPPRAD